MYTHLCSRKVNNVTYTAAHAVTRRWCAVMGLIHHQLREVSRKSAK